MTGKKAGEPLTPSTKDEASAEGTETKFEKTASVYSSLNERKNLRDELELFIYANFSDAEFDGAVKKYEARREKETTSRREEPKGVYKRDKFLRGFLEDWKKIHTLLDVMMEEFQKDDTLLRINKVPIYICGDLHGQHGDLLQLFEVAGKPWDARFLFLGDYVDRGEYSYEVILLLFACRIVYPKSIFILRGNHELININTAYGFKEELKRRFRSTKIPTEIEKLHAHFNEVFSWMPLAALVGKRILCMHGGIGPDLNDLEDINKIPRPLRMVHRGLAQDLLWADPDKAMDKTTKDGNFDRNKVRGVSYVFGTQAVRKKCHDLNIDVIIRAHQVVEFGYAIFGIDGREIGKEKEKTGKNGRIKDGALVTIFSAARYHDELLNYSAFVLVRKDLVLTFVQLKPANFLELRSRPPQSAEDPLEGDDNSSAAGGGGQKR